MNFCSVCGAMIENENAQFCANCGSPLSAPEAGYVPEYVPQQPVMQYKMKWYKFLINFALFASAVLNFVNGFNYITGGIYFAQSDGRVSAEMVYDMYGSGMKVLDVLLGISMIALAGFCIYTRSRLAKYKVNGPMCVYILYGVGTVLTPLYNLALWAVTGLNQLTSVNSVTTLGMSVGFLLLNYAYFAKRKELFIY